MDFVVIEIFYLFWFSLTLEASGDLTVPYPVNKAVLDGTKNVTINCGSTVNFDAIKWSFIPVGSTEKTIKDGDSITDDAFVGYADRAGKSYTLIIKEASSSTAGTYSCEEGEKKSVLLIVLGGEPSCDYSPRETNQVSCESTLQLSCTVSFIANTTLVAPDLQWSAQPPTDSLEKANASSSTSGITTTATSLLNVTWPKKGDRPIPTYRCKATFRMIKSTSQPKELIERPPQNFHRCQPFASASSVPCIGKDGVLRTAVPQTTVSNDYNPEAPEFAGNLPDSDDNPNKSGNSSVRSAETNNLAIRVLGVAGVLLLAQMF